MSLGIPNLAIGTRSQQPASRFTCPNCKGKNGIWHFIWMGFGSDGPWSTRCADCGYCDRCGKADDVQSG